MLMMLKFLVKSILEKKFRTFLIVISVAISAALFFASLAIADTLEGIISKQIKKYYGDTDIIMTASEKSKSSFFYYDNLGKYEENIEYGVGSIQIGGTYKKNRNEYINISIFGMTYEDMIKMGTVSIDKDYKMQPFEGNKIIIGPETAKKMNVDIGDTVDLTISDKVRRLTVCAISKRTGIFADESTGSFAVMPISTVGGYYNAKGKVTQVFLKTKKGINTKVLVEALNQEFNKNAFYETIPIEELKDALNRVSAPFLIVSLLVSFMSIFIIYTSFKVIAFERLPVIGTLRSIGATRKATNAILFMESGFYGIVAGAIGCGLGILILYAMLKIMLASERGLQASLNYTGSQCIAAFVFAVILSLGSSIFPIIKVTGVSLKDIILNSIHWDVKKRKKAIILGPLLLIVSMIVPGFLAAETDYGVALPINVLCILSIAFSIIVMLPVLVAAIVKVISIVYGALFGNEGIMAAKNIKDNKNLLNNISLIAIGMSIILTINIISGSVAKDVLSIFVKSMNFDISLYGMELDKNFISLLNSTEGVADSYPCYETRGIKVGDGESRIGSLVGIDQKKYFDYWKIELYKKIEDSSFNFDEDRNIYISNTLKERFKVDVGNYIELTMGETKKKYMVAGLFNTLVDNGDMAMIPERYFKLDTRSSFYSSVYIKTSIKPSNVKENIRKKFERRYLNIRTVEDMKNQSMEGNAQTFAIMQGFAALAVVIGIFGIVNNLIISFMERRRIIAVLRSIGMSKRQIIKMIALESFSSGVIGGILGIMTCIMILRIVPSLLKVIIGIEMGISISVQSVIINFIVAVVVMLIASLVPALKSSKLSIVQAIKYE
ncbi:FtsX-like permease family protein [Pseudobacteroides cellulosolvens]|uniref:MacB-like periplasmic core domain containing protein n=1 Tax=Pseudobacteroides cellulosolvens ATCC 35603 = DSM 2933 TaxID=398512 RepID=A0A0L6JUN1_9FIRM|nr:FtsX-like permease family protein [Pseudobacteroides cellulosolvens]KNY29429.1 MacB-like periplasmic core domain containing protein [Pseudobacteroides cellulosolvens ATCC 35603 = DSM 2933]